MGFPTKVQLISRKASEQYYINFRLYSKDRVEESHLFDQAREPLLENLAPGEPFVVALDDTIVRKTGRKIHGSGWKRDPLGPAFQTNLVQAQRYLQFSAAWPLRDRDGAPTGEARMIPIDLLHAPSPVKPRKGTVDPAATAAYREALKQQNLNCRPCRPCCGSRFCGKKFPPPGPSSSPATAVSPTKPSSAAFPPDAFTSAAPAKTPSFTTSLNPRPPRPTAARAATANPPPPPKPFAPTTPFPGKPSGPSPSAGITSSASKPSARSSGVNPVPSYP